MDDTKASSDIQGLDSMRRGDFQKMTSPSRTSQAEDEAAGFTYCESLFQFPGRVSALGDSDTPDSPQQKQMKLYRFLEDQKLEFLFDTLIDAGYDDLDQITFQMRSTLPLDLSTLESIGIRKYSHRALLLAAFEHIAGVTRARPADPEGVSMCCGRLTPRAASLDPLLDLKAWLREAGLEHWHSHFVEAGFADLDRVLLLMNSTCPVTEEVLRDVLKIPSPEDRFRLLQKLAKDSRVKPQSDFRAEKESKVSACTCRLM